MGSFTEAVVQFVRDHEAWAVPIVFLLAFAESLAFLSLAVPSTFILVGIAGLYGASGGTAVLPLVIVAGIGGSIGYTLSYLLGYYFRDEIKSMWPFRNYPEMMQRGQDFFDKYGALGVFFGHFFGPVRAVIPVIAGMYQTPQVPFQIANIASAFLWAAGVIAPSYFGMQWLSG